MYELEEKGYLYLLGIIPVLVLLFLYVQFWKRKKQREFGDIDLVKKSGTFGFQTCFEIRFVADGFGWINIWPNQSKNRNQNGNRQTRRHRYRFCHGRF